MRKEPNLRAERHRRIHPTLGASDPGANWGFFEVGPLRIVSSGEGDEWEHVSVSCASRCPTWEEMQTVKELFWRDDETVLQFHPKKSEYINHHPYCLHLWKMTGEDHPLPPRKTLA